MTPTSRLLAAALLVIPACSPSPEREASPEAPGTPAAKPARPPAESTPTPTATAGPASEAEKPAQPGGVPPAIRELKEKLQPKSGPPAEIPDDKTLVAEAKTFATRFVELCGAGDVDGAKKMAFTSKDFEEALTPGHRDILEGNLTSQNNAIIERLATLLAGKKLTPQLQPGGLVRAASGSFRGSPPMLSNSVLAIDVDGTPVEVVFDQLVYTGGGWKIFRLTAP